MLSSENPPPNPLSSSQTSQLKSASCSSNICRDGGGGGGRQPAEEELDLSKSGLDDNIPLPKFSIRDYVFNARRKDIENHWPFSPENLQLCLKHGVKDVLPPFDSSVEITNTADATEFSDHRLCVSSNYACEKLDLDIDHIEVEEENGNPLAFTSPSDSGLNSVPAIKAPYIEQSSAEKREPLGVPASNKDGINLQTSVRKCKLIGKLISAAEPKQSEDSSVGTSVASETMVSQVCPVCKTFSSSSNTTLNAHIDQCLSGEPEVKVIENPKAVKSNIKPRKIVSMAEIYATAVPCTLEDLDRRNGTNWASNLDILVEDTEVCLEEKNGASSSEKNLVGGGAAVYFDSDGTKLCSLSKFGDDLCPPKLVKTSEGREPLSAKKKRQLVHRDKLSNTRDQMKFDDFGMIKQWSGSKRTGLKRKVDSDHRNQCLDKIAKGSTSSRRSPVVGNKFVKRRCDTNVERKKNQSTSDDEYIKQHCLEKGHGYSSLAYLDGRGRKNNLKLPKHDLHSTKDDPSVRKRCSTNSWFRKKMRSSSPAGNGNGSFVESRILHSDAISSKGEKFSSVKKTVSDHASSPGGKKSSPLKKNVLSAKHGSVSQLERSRTKNIDYKKRRRMHRVYTSDEDAAENASQIEHASRKLLTDSAKILEIQDVDAPVDKSNVLNPVKELEIRDEVSCEPTSKVLGGEPLTAFGNSSDPESVRHPGLHDPKMNSQDCVKAYQEHRLSDLGNEENYSAEKVSKGDAGEARGSYCVDVDPIPVPSPPGSFLPSPGRMGSEELHGNSSLTTCRVLSSEDDEHELVDVDMSDSPVSATSFASNSIAAAAAAQSQVVGICRDHSQRNGSEESCVPFELTEQQPKLMADMVLKREASPDGAFKIGEPCCCSRKERNGSSNDHHDWERLRGRQTVSFLEPIPSQKPYDVNPRSESTLPPTNTVSSRNLDAKFPAYGDSEPPTPSSSSSVLRLMGKNLMVVKTEENQDRSSQIAPTVSKMWSDDHPTLRSSVIAGSSFRPPECYLYPRPFTYKSGEYSDQHCRFGPQNSTLTGYGVEKAPAPISQLRTATISSSLQQCNEIIILDDSPANDESLASIRASSCEDVRISAASAYEYRHVNHRHPFYDYQTAPSLHSGSQMVTWNHNPGGSIAVHPNSAPPLPAGRHLRSSPYVFSSSSFRLD
ncbi:uncharacterized protein LOC127254118 [Andrographis paniculata]|uniref:uncharacterized protein LOC127254118 n=1 Tax=Andrographis paniculata TaxID=175694 RepID=UPI0021E93CFF|nr:uncharacterized protein LOC127254118 [Andrographis paniculata]XP_051134977.1 uncharacterized protein LOC127254118 [Andrographis paniculata]XP_051134978.1 uncharacterized protein LOC127254118 [Andrographis paniculata]XP_051134979.1 uncharacterized protein LOC127254118 [Andrographis paniculata]XP_051134980.1 uncharacterized protein LOC127254118 [Andrographis paniculata]XP_051134981.1 uncharacterized protein LOC127254118 [Andrographis paniculata]XP_051134983.1 uncharacterized protein LOC12725